MHLPPVDDHMAVTDITGETIEATIFEPGIFRNNQLQFIVADGLQVADDNSIRAIQDDLLPKGRMRPFRVESLRD